MIPGWASESTGAEPIVVPMPPVSLLYRDGAGEPSSSVVPDTAVLVAGGGSITAIAGFTEGGVPLAEATLLFSGVFAVAMLDYMSYVLGWKPCGARPDTTWESC